MTTVYRGTILHALAPQQFEFWPEAELVVGPDGRILELRDGHFPVERDATLVDHSGRVILPGLVDAHYHIPQIDVIGIASEQLIDWLRRHIFSAEIENEDPEVARDRAQRSFHGLLASGTTAVAAFSSRHTVATEIALEEAAHSGIRAIVGKVLMDREAPSELLEEPPEALDATARLIERWHGGAEGRLGVAVTPRFGITCSDAMLAGAGKLATHAGVPVQTHLSENKAELRRIAELFPDAPDYTAVYERAGLLGERTILAHCIHLEDGEIDRLAAAGCCAVYCPDSNFFLHSGRFPLDRCRERGLDIALGTDIGAGTSWSLLETMKMANYMQMTPVDPALLLYLGTLGGARALGWDDRIGNLIPGKEADFIVLDVDEVFAGRAAASWAPPEMLSMLIHRGHRARVEEVYIRGVRIR